MRKLLMGVLITVLCSGCVAGGNYTRNRNDGMIETYRPGLIETAVALPFAILGGVTKALVGETIRETTKQYEARLKAEAEARANVQTVITYYDPYYYPPPFWPSYQFVQWYQQPGYVFFIGNDGRHHRHHYNGHNRGRHR